MDKVFMRRGEARGALGLDERVFANLIEQGLITPFIPKPRRGRQQARALFYSNQINTLAARWQKGKME